MPYLNWLNVPIETTKTSHDRYESQLTVKLERDAMRKLAASLEDVLKEVEGDYKPELRVDLSASWTLFWKAREGETRILLAHPGKDTWVATVAVDPEAGLKLIAALKGAEAFRVSELGRVGRVSNLEIEFQPKGEN